MTGETEKPHMELLRSIDVAAEAAALAAPFRIELRMRGDRAVLVEVDPLDWEQADYAFREKHPKPKPPCTRELVKDEAILRALGERSPVVLREYDGLDNAYLLAVERWKDERAFAVLAACMKLELRDGERPLTSTEERVKALRRLGLTAALAWQLFALIEKQGAAREAELVGFSGAGSGPVDGAVT